MLNVITYLFITFTIFFYNYYFGGSASILLGYVLVLGPIFSFFMIYPVYKKIEINVELPKDEIEKGRSVSAKALIQNNSALPLPFLYIIPHKPKNFKLETVEKILSMAPNSKTVIEIEYTAKNRGVACIGFNDIYIKDYLGFFRFSLIKKCEKKDFSVELIVLPEIYDVKLDNSLFIQKEEYELLNTANINGYNMLSYCVSGNPGYEYREFQAGDSLHKVHWKLSAKKDSLMVRKDDILVKSSKTIIVNPFIEINNSETKNVKLNNTFGFFDIVSILKDDEEIDPLQEEFMTHEDLILDELVSIADKLIKSGMEVFVWLYERQEWVFYVLKDRKSLHEFRGKLALYNFLIERSEAEHTFFQIKDIVLNQKMSHKISFDEIIFITGRVDEDAEILINGLRKENADIYIFEVFKN